MPNVSIQNNNLVVTMTGLRRIFTLRKELSFPLGSVKGVTHDPTISSDYPSGWEKRKGTNVFRTYYGGTFRKNGEQIFWDVLKPENTIVVTLQDQEFQRLIIEVDDPKEAVQMIEQAINH